MRLPTVVRDVLAKLSRRPHVPGPWGAIEEHDRAMRAIAPEGQVPNAGNADRRS